MRNLSLLLILLLTVSSCDSNKEKAPTSESSFTKGSLDKNSIAIDYANIALKEWFNTGPGKIEDYDFGSPIVKSGNSVYCNNQKIDFTLVCFDDKVKSGCTYVFLEFKDDFFYSILSRGETEETPDQLYKSALEADENTNDFWMCGDAD
jgi:hypothetical protein